MLVATAGGGAGIGDDRRTRLAAASSNAGLPGEFCSLTDSTSPMLDQGHTAGCLGNSVSAIGIAEMVSGG